MQVFNLSLVQRNSAALGLDTVGNDWMLRIQSVASSNLPPQQKGDLIAGLLQDAASGKARFATFLKGEYEEFFDELLIALRYRKIAFLELDADQLQ